MKVFVMNDCDWWMAETLEAAIAGYMNSGHGLPEAEALDSPRELTEEELDCLQFYVDDSKTEHRSFREELNRRIAADNRSQFFASTEF